MEEAETTASTSSLRPSVISGVRRFGFDGSAAEDSGGAELCSFAPPDVSPFAPSEDFMDSSFAAPDSAGAEPCCLAPVD
jgi:hypothetical protein